MKPYKPKSNLGRRQTLRVVEPVKEDLRTKKEIDWQLWMTILTIIMGCGLAIWIASVIQARL